MSNRSKGHAKRSRTCKCGRVIRGNAYAQLCVTARAHDPPLPQKPPNVRGWP